MTLFFYSGGDAAENQDMDRALIDTIGLNSTKITFVPSAAAHAYEDFDAFMEYYGSYGFRDFRMLMIDSDYSARDAQHALETDLVYFGGGNTFYLLYHLRRSGFADLVQEYLDDGGVVAGESAGGIVLTNSIATASFPSFDRDDNDIGLADLRGLDLVSFEFFPHYTNRPRYSRELRKYSRDSSRPLLACPDGAGVIVAESEVRLVGEVYIFVNGHRCQINELF